MKNPHHHLVQFLHLILFGFQSLFLFPLLLLLPLVRLASTLSLSPFSLSSEVVQDGLGLAAIDHLLQAFVTQLVASEVDLLQLRAVAHFRRDLAQLVIREIKHL